MKEGAQLFFLFFLVTFFSALPCLGAEAGTIKKTFDVGDELREKTFFIVELGQSKKAQKDYHAYFKNNGILAIKFSPKHWKYDRWEVDDKGTLCVTTTLRKLKKAAIYSSKCGRFVKSSDTTYRWYNGDGQHRANFSLKGKGERLP